MREFNLNQDYVLEDDFALLRPLKADDIENLLPFSVHEPDLWTYSLVQAGGGREQMQHYLSLALEARTQGKEYPFIVYDKRTNAYAGSTRFYDIQPAHQVLQLGYTWYGKAFQGTGLNKHCKYLLLEFVFEQLQWARLELRADNNNIRSINAMKSIGCTVEGVLRSNSVKGDGTRRDSIVLSVLRNEWFNHVKDMLMTKMKERD